MAVEYSGVIAVRDAILSTYGIHIFLYLQFLAN